MSDCAAAADLGYRERARVDARLAGPKGNVEIFVWLASPAASTGDAADDTGATLA